MSTFLSDFFQSNAQNSGASMTDAGVYSAAQNLTNVSASQSTAQLNATRVLQFALSELKAGDVFQGEVQSVQGEEVLLKLLNGEVLRARLEGQMVLSLGQRLQFQVQSNEQNKIVLKPYQQILQQVGESALKAASLPVNARSLQMVSELMEAGLPVDKNSLTAMYRNQLSFPDTNPKTFYALQQLDIPITKDNIAQYESYKNLEHKLLDGMSEILDDIETVFEGLPKQEQAAFAKQILHAVDGDTTQARNQQVTSENQQNQPRQTFMSHDISEETIPIEGKSEITGTQQAESEAVTVSESTKQTIQDVAANTENILKHEEGSHMQPQVVPDENVRNEAESNLTQVPQNKTAFTHTEIELHQLLEQMVKEPPEKAKKLFRDHMEQQIQKSWMLEPKEVADKEKVQKLYERVQREAADIQEAMDKFGRDMGKVPQSAQNVQKNIAFIYELNQMFSYVQLPLRMNSTNAHGDLYVLARKKNLSQKDVELTAFLHLDMEHLGTTEVKLTLQTTEHVLRCDFFLSEDSVKLVSEHIGELQQTLEKKGYHTKTSVGVLQEEKNVMERMEEAAGLHMTSVSYQSFDIRA